MDFGNIIWWIEIYNVNRHKIEDPKIIHPGQKLVIPDLLAHYSVPLNEDQVQKMVAMSKSGEYAKKSREQKNLKKFRQAFKKVVESKKKAQQESKNVEEQEYQGLGLGSMILDETRSKMGSNFYSVFYKQWEDPPNVQNFTITVSEQPMRSRGTLVQVEIDNQLVYRDRLEPRYYKTEQAAKQAVKICQRQLKQIATMDDDLAGY